MERRAGRVLLLIVLGLVSGALSVPERGWAAGARTRQTHACIFDHVALRTKTGTCRPRARVYPAYVRNKVERAVYDSSLIFGMPYQVLLTIAQCESGLNPHASNGRHFGLFQFAPATFHRGRARMRRDTGIIARSYWSPLDSSYVAGYLFATGQAKSWSCEPASG